MIKALHSYMVNLENSLNHTRSSWSIPLHIMLKPTVNLNQVIGQPESSNKTLIKLIKKKIEDNLRRRHEVLSETLWDHRISRHGATKVTHFELVYGQEVVLLVEANLTTYKLANQKQVVRC
jgi:hypothetical protein